MQPITAYRPIDGIISRLLTERAPDWNRPFPRNLQVANFNVFVIGVLTMRLELHDDVDDDDDDDIIMMIFSSFQE